MDPFDREILGMCHFEELRDAEVAAILGIDKTAAPRTANQRRTASEAAARELEHMGI
jgi:hypothetical protein